jgi:homoserine dehydrogenase
MITAAKTTSHRYTTFANTDKASPEVEIATDWDSSYYLHMKVLDKPGVLAEIAGALARHNVSVSSCVQRGWDVKSVPIYIITHRTREKNMMAAVEELKSLPSVIAVPGLIRVEE